MQTSRDAVAASPVRVVLDGPVWHVTLDRPQRGNALAADTVEALDGVLQQAGKEHAQAVILRGSGRHFCTGFDLSDIEAETDDSLLARFVRVELMLQRLACAPFLTVAVAQGRTMGAGADLFAACTMRWVEGDVTFAFPGARGFGLVLGTRRLSELVGVTTALDWIESGRTIGRDEALRARLVTHAIDAGSTPEAVLDSRSFADPSTRRALRHASDPHREHLNALDLQRLVESAARPGLRDRIREYTARVSTNRVSPRSDRE